MVVLEKNGSILAKLVVFGKKGFFGQKCYRVKWLYSGKSGFFWVKVVVFCQKWLYCGWVVVFVHKWLYSGKVVVFEQKVL